jgi:DNA polymerase II large subunit
MLTEFEIDHTKKEMHNSGNDAYYTVKLLEKLNIKPIPETVIEIITTVENKIKPKMSIKP